MDDKNQTIVISQPFCGLTGLINPATQMCTANPDKSYIDLPATYSAGKPVI
jgi:hypothetical protein